MAFTEGRPSPSLMLSNTEEEKRGRKEEF